MLSLHAIVSDNPYKKEEKVYIPVMLEKKDGSQVPCDCYTFVNTDSIMSLIKKDDKVIITGILGIYLFPPESGLKNIVEITGITLE